MLRILIFALIGYLLYHAIKRVLGSGRTLKRGGGDAKVIDEMVQDPVCKTYIPLRESVKRRIGGRQYFFCSEECADKFEAERKNRA